MAEQDKTVRFISKLVELTQKRAIEWQVSDLNEDKSMPRFESEVEGRVISVYRYSREMPNPDYSTYQSRASSSLGIVLSSRPEPPRTIVREGTSLDVLDDHGNVAYSFKNVTGLSDLIEAASFSASKVDILMDAVLSKK